MPAVSETCTGFLCGASPIHADTFISFTCPCLSADQMLHLICAHLTSPSAPPTPQVLVHESQPAMAYEDKTV